MDNFLAAHPANPTEALSGLLWLQTVWSHLHSGLQNCKNAP